MKGTFLIYGIDGQELIKQLAMGSKVEFNVSSLSKGFYYVRLINNEKIKVGKFLKE
jgi:hypothetical protein